jgi:hypothetical protein
LFIYCLIGISEIVLRFRTGSAGLRVKMWLFPVLSIVTVAGSSRSWRRWASWSPPGHN